MAAVPASQSRAFAVRQLRFWLGNYRRTWQGSIYSSVLSPVLYLGAMGLGLGKLVNQHGTASLGGVSYLAFLAPGLLAAGAMQTAMGESAYPILASVKWLKTYQAAIASPLRPVDLQRGHLLFTTLAFAAPIEAYAITRDKDGSFALLFRFGVIPLFLFSGTFFPVSQLPAVIRPLAYITPLWHGVALCRSLSLGTAEFLPSIGHTCYLLAVTAIGVCVGSLTYRRRLYA